MILFEYYYVFECILFFFKYSAKNGINLYHFYRNRIRFGTICRWTNALSNCRVLRTSQARAVSGNWISKEWRKANGPDVAPRSRSEFATPRSNPHPRQTRRRRQRQRQRRRRQRRRQRRRSMLFRTAARHPPAVYPALYTRPRLVACHPRFRTACRKYRNRRRWAWARTISRACWSPAGTKIINWSSSISWTPSKPSQGDSLANASQESLAKQMFSSLHTSLPPTSRSIRSTQITTFSDRSETISIFNSVGFRNNFFYFTNYDCAKKR